MQIGLVGLGRMGAGMTERLEGRGHDVRSFDPNVPSTADSLEELTQQLEPPRAVWLMVPAGAITEESIRSLLSLLEEGDVIVDGGNSHFRDSMRRAEEASRLGVHLLDVGVSGGIWGPRKGYCLMVGGDLEPVRRLEPVFQTLAPGPDGVAHVGGSGAGHFVKMVHNGVEYGLMQAYAEGLELLRANGEMDIDLRQVAALWQHGSVVRSWLLELVSKALDEDPDLESIAGYVEDSGEGRWTLEEAIRLAVPAPALSAALFSRFRSRQDDSFAAKVCAALRRQFGGHAVRDAVGS